MSDLIERLQDPKFVSSLVNTAAEAADRIEELEATLSKVKILLERENTRQFIIDVIKTETARQHTIKEDNNNV